MNIRISFTNRRFARRLTAFWTVLALIAVICFSTHPVSVVKADGDTQHATQVQFTNPAPIAPADRPTNSAGTEPGLPPLADYPSLINVTGLTGMITKVTVSFEITSTWPDDLDILLVGPSGAKTLLISDGGGGGNISNRSFTFDQTAGVAFPDDGTDAVPVPAGTYQPSNYLGFVTPEPGGQDNFPIAGGLQSFPTPSMEVFNGTSPNGNWSLYVVDDQAIDFNSLPNGWRLDITTTTTPTVPTSRVCDFDGDNKTDIAVVRNSAGALTWLINNSMSGTPTTQNWGLSSDFLVPHDYDGDGKTDIAVFRPGSPGTWYLIRSSDSTIRAINFGQTGDNPSIVDDYDGDGKADLAVVRNVGGAKIWYVLNSVSIITDGAGGGPVTVRQWGLDTDFVVPGDHDGDGKADYGVQRAEGVAPNKATFYFALSSGGSFARPWGQNTDIVVPGDYDGDNETDIAVVHTEGGNYFWWIVLSNGGLVLGDQWGQAGDLTVQGDYDGDGKTDQAVWRTSTATFMIKQSGGGVVSIPFGLPGDNPPAFYNTH